MTARISPSKINSVPGFGDLDERICANAVCASNTRSIRASILPPLAFWPNRRASASGLIAAKLVPYFLINQLQFVGMLLLGRYLLPEIGVPALILNGSLVPYALLSAAVSAAALGYALLISVCAKSTEHAVVLGGGCIILMAAIGGIMVPAHVMPETMQQLTWISPMAWGLKAFQELLLNRSGLDGIGRYLILLSAFSFATLTAAVLVYRRQLQTQVRF